MDDPHKIAEKINSRAQDYALAKLKRFAAFLGAPLDPSGQTLPPRLQDRADAIGDQCCADLETIAYWQHERGR